MRQKTFVLTGRTCFTPHEGDEAILVCNTDIRTGHETWYLYRGEGGVPGNMNASVKRYHGWRGTTANISVDAFGLRRVERISKTKGGEIKVTVGRDLHPEWD